MNYVEFERAVSVHKQFDALFTVEQRSWRTNSSQHEQQFYSSNRVCHRSQHCPPAQSGPDADSGAAYGGAEARKADDAHVASCWRKFVHANHVSF